jgi:hypothetical protein
MFAPDIREEALGLDPLGWLTTIVPFTDPAGTAEPDLLVLGVLQSQPPSLAAWDQLLARGLPIDLRDGERGDSYRRMLRWFGNLIWADADDPAQVEAALAAGRTLLAFEILGTPASFDFHVRDASGSVVEMGGESPGGTLVIGCPTLHSASPRGPDDPEIGVHVLKDGQPWHEGCGEVPTDGPGVYRVEVDIVPLHLRPFLGSDPDPWLHSYPWLYGNAIRVTARRASPPPPSAP